MVYSHRVIIMKTNLDRSIIQLTFGVLFNHKFKLLDSWGEIADDILYKNQYFSPDFFTNISSQYTTERQLFNPARKHSLLLTSNNLVYTQTIESDFDSECELFKKRVSEYLVPNLLTRYTLVVRRLGVVYVCELDDSDIQRFAANFFNPTVQNIMDFRFSRKEPTDKGLILSDNADFINKIFTVGNISEGIKGVSYDYQLHFTPLHEDVRDSIDSFMTKSMTGFNTDVACSFGG